MALPNGAIKTTLAFSQCALVGKFTWMWPSPRLMETWIEQTWKSKMRGNIRIYAHGNGVFVFLFEFKGEWDVIFRNKPYLFRFKGKYLNQGSLDFNPNKDIPTETPVWVNLPHLPLSFWSDDCLQATRNGVGKYID